MKEPRNFDSFKERFNYSQVQLKYIEQYLMDFKAICEKLKLTETAEEAYKRNLMLQKKAAAAAAGTAPTKEVGAKTDQP